MLSIIIPCYNRYDDLERCLRSIRAQPFSDYEIIVVDDHSDEALANLMQPGELYLRNERNCGPAYSRNLGILRASGEVVLFLDSDSEVLEETLEYIHDTLLTDESLGCLGGSGPAADGRLQPQYVKGKDYSAWGRSLSVPYTESDFDHSPMIECDHFESACMGVRRSVLMRSGGFDPYWFYMGEERELCLKIRRMGYRNAVAWRARAIHHERDLETKLKPESHRFYQYRFFEVAVKLDGIQGGMKWLWAHRTEISLRFVATLFKNLPKTAQILKRRGKNFLDADTLSMYAKALS